MAYQLEKDLYVARFPDLTARSLVAPASREARWSAASSELFYIQAAGVKPGRGGPPAFGYGEACSD